MTTKTITIEPDYESIYKRFSADAIAQLERFARNGEKRFSRREVYGFISSLNVTLNSMSNTAQLNEFRANLHEAAVKVFDKMNEEESF